ncbi:MAG: hypothetical protein LBB57_00480 [Clostridiales Family XIII bacterium]|jgi:hypothetical protein|nr:hypothetical protein [Clostridiales Family XIII bacterium]
MCGFVRQAAKPVARAPLPAGGSCRPPRRAVRAARRGRPCNKRGTTLVEAAIVFPLVIASVMAVIYLMINLYSFTALRASLHVALRAEADAETGLTEALLADGRVYDRYRLAAERRGIFAERRRKGLNSYVSAEESKQYRGNAMITEGVTRKHFGRVYILDEVSVVRNLSLAKAAAGNGGEDEE